MTTSPVATTPAMVEKHYQTLGEKLARYRKTLGRPLSLTEKILLSHLASDKDIATIERGKSFVLLRPDRVAMQDATAQMAILQFIQSGRPKVAVPTTVHCDHLIEAHVGSKTDTDTANKTNAEVYDFLKSASEKYGIGFWGPGAGIIHQVVLENYAFPGGLIIGTDSHTPNAGGLGMLAIGVGGADAVDVMAAIPWELLYPKIVAVRLKGKLSSWTAPKDVILKVLEKLTVKGGTNKIIEYIGEGAASISATGKGTITNMGAELGATTSTFPYDASMKRYLEATGRKDLAQLAEKYKEHLMPDSDAVANPAKVYDEIIDIDLDALHPYLVGPHSPDKARPVSALAAEADKEGYPRNISACLVGSCTNSSYEDITRAASIVRQALELGLKSKVPFYVSPGSSQIYATIKRDGLLKTLEDFGAVVLANACGPCIGQWKRDGAKVRNSIVTSFNRNFKGRNDDNAETLAFIGSPEMVVAYAISGDLGFDPERDSLKVNGKDVKLHIPTGSELPPQGFVFDTSGYLDPAKDGSSLKVQVSPQSDRLQLLAPFAKWNGSDFADHLLLTKAKGKCTTDHISPAGKWLKYRGHLDKISDNMLLGAVNAFDDKVGMGTNTLTGEADQNFSKMARDYKAKGHSSVIVGDENYGEGSSREHAAMSPRYLGISTVIVKSFARIHETNLKKQGVLALTFANPADYDKIQEGDKVSVRGLKDFAPKKPFTVEVKRKDGQTFTFSALHTYNDEQIGWFRAGSCLNQI